MRKLETSEEVELQIIDQYTKDNKFLYQISESLNVPLSVIYNTLDKYNIPKRTNKQNQKISHSRDSVKQKMRIQNLNIDEAIDLYVNHKWSGKDLSEKYGVEWRVLRLRFTEKGIKIRGNQEAQKISATRPEVREKLSQISRYSIKYLQEKHPLFCKVEEIREDPETGRIQTHCKNHNCPNSKENGGWFTPTGSQIINRIGAIERPCNTEEMNFYCCDKCKQDCPLYGKKAITLIKQDQIKAGIIEEPDYTDEEYNVFRLEVLKRQRETNGKNECELCGSVENLRVHHEKPKKTHPHMTLDPDNGIVVCHNCHMKKFHVDECSTGKLASLICT